MTSTTARYRRRPVEVEAVKWHGEINCEEVFGFLGWEHPDDEMDHSVIYVDAPGGTVTAQHGDWIVRNERGEFGVCVAELFEATYEPAVMSSGRAALLHEAADRDAVLRELVIGALHDARRNGLGGMTEAEAVEHMADAVLRRVAAEEQPAETQGGDRVKAIADAIGPTMLLGLQDAELFDEPGQERIRDWVKWISETVAALPTTERPVVGEQPDTQEAP